MADNRTKSGRHHCTRIDLNEGMFLRRAATRQAAQKHGMNIGIGTLLSSDN